MTRRKKFNAPTSHVRNSLNLAVDLADRIHQEESRLILLLKEIDEHKYYVRFGYNSLMGFCKNGLRFTKIQSQRIATQVRRSEPMANLGTQDKEQT